MQFFPNQLGKNCQGWWKTGGWKASEEIGNRECSIKKTKVSGMKVAIQ